MEYKEALSRYVANFVDELSRNGLTDVVISPGSRSTPLALTFAEHRAIKEWVIIDERSAAFFALGMAKQMKKPVALVCTSGTAAANYLPAIVEAYYSRVPLIVLTGDRPPELQDVGAPQTIEQHKLYGEHVKWFHNMALPEGSPQMLHYVRSKAARSYHVAIEGNKGPVHLNFPFREPLMPDFTIENVWGESQNTYHLSADGKKHLSEQQLEILAKKLAEAERGLIVCGPQTDYDVAQAIADLAWAFHIPVLADPLSQMRSGSHDKTNVVEGYNSILRNKNIRKMLKPDLIIRFGAMPVSKSYTFYVKENADAEQIVVENNAGFREPTGSRTKFVFADVVSLCMDLIHQAPEKAKQDQSWLQTWQRMNGIAKKHLFAGEEVKMTEGEAVRALMEILPDDSSLYVGNSMAIRDVDMFYQTDSKKIELLANRGVNGIDGMISSALGAAAAGKKVTLLIGDLSFFHDMNGLLAARHYDLPITILLINNNGGGIFSFLQQAKEPKHFELLFGTPADIEFSKAVNMYGGKHRLVQTKRELIQSLQDSYAEKGIKVIEIQTDREENKNWHEEKWRAIELEILNSKDE